MTFSKWIGLLLLLLSSVMQPVHAQEYLLPLQENTVLKTGPAQAGGIARRPTVLTLPFFEDFTDDSPYPNTERWANSYVYINNTMGRQVISRGVATFDALNERGKVYYDSVDAYTTISADTLTSQPIDMSGQQPADSVYLSFFYQPKGYGFSPKATDSLSLYLLNSSGVWQKVWAQPGDTGQYAFRQVMIPVTDTGYFNNNFRMRWINLATLGVSNSHWNLDYIRLAEGRNQYDTLVRDIAFTTAPGQGILNDFTAMPFRHFKTNPAAFLSPNLIAYLRNNGITSQNLSLGYRASVVPGGTILGTGATTLTATPNDEWSPAMTMYNAGAYNPANPNGQVIFENRFYCSSVYTGESKENDTIVHNQVFDNYFAYDDGTAEQSYFLNLYPSAPGYTAVEYALYQPDTLRGIAIRFATTQPLGALKEFAIAVYRDIAVNGGSDQLLRQEDFLFPQYEDTINKLSVYQFETPLVMDAGVFYVAIVQAAGSSDSLQIALDANRAGANHRYFKVGTHWEPSLLDGALLLRPLLGAALPVGISSPSLPELRWNFSPNPAGDQVQLHIPGLRSGKAQYTVTDIQGRQLLGGNTGASGYIDVSSLRKGMYFIRLESKAGYLRPAKLLKR